MGEWAQCPHACDHCEPCQWRLTGNHPDLIRVVPAADAAAAATDAEAEAPAEPSKICKKCKIDKPLTEYYFVGIASDRPAPTVRRRLSACKSCCSNYSRNQHRKKK